MSAAPTFGTAILLTLCIALWSTGALAAGFTETLPAGTWLLDVSYNVSWLDSAYDNNGNRGPLLDRIERYEPGGGLQGIITPDVSVVYQVLLMQLQYGILDSLSVGLGVPLVLSTAVDPSLKWTPGDYQQVLGRAYTEQDFWDWAGSMGQPKPGRWVGNEGTLSDIIVGLRWRFTDRFESWKRSGLASSIMVYGAIPTGSPPDPEEILAAGTTSWDLHAQGDLGVHLSLDKTFRESLDDRLTLGLDAFYEAFLPRRLDTPRGVVSPLLLNYVPYAGEHYTLDPGDFAGFSLQADVVPYRGPERATWLSDGGGVTPSRQGSTFSAGNSGERAATFPPIISVSLRYTFTALQQSYWHSASDLWDWEREKMWRPGYKNILGGRVTASFLRLGVPLQVYANCRTLALLPGKNTRAADVLTGGIQVPVKFW